MARIPEAEIERLKREIALERLVEARVVVLKRKGADLDSSALVPINLNITWTHRELSLSTSMVIFVTKVRGVEAYPRGKQGCVFEKLRPIDPLPPLA